MSGMLAAGLTHDTLRALQQAEHQSSFLLVPEGSDNSSRASTAARSLGESLPQVWQDLFAAARSAQSGECLDGLACRPPLPPAAGLALPARTGGAGQCGNGSPGSSGRSCSSSRGDGDPTLGISRDTVFTLYLSPEALVQHHRLGKPEVRRLYQALQVYSLGFHQGMLELTRHASGKGLLLLAIWRGFAMLWDGALQVVFPAETVQASRERQAALLTGERLLEQLQGAEARAAALEEANAALKRQMEGMAVQLLSVQADAAAARQGAAGLQQQLRAAQAERAAAVAQADAGRLELLQIQEKLAALAGPQEEAYVRAQQLERALKEKAGQLSTAAKQAAAALAAKEDAQQAGRRERLRREAAEQRAQQLAEQLNQATLQLRAASGAAAVRAEQQQAEAAAKREQQAADAVAREDDTARLATERASWQRQAADATAAAEGLRSQLSAAVQQLEAEKSRNGELVDSLWPLAAKVKALEAAAAAGAGASGSG